ncbi:hypothetical protein VIBRN418_04008 [Vibrio sp. N418]|nr:hypothetical protein VIBRN418_04008 [Vibrio sp. N418]
MHLSTANQGTARDLRDWAKVALMIKVALLTEAALSAKAAVSTKATTLHRVA